MRRISVPIALLAVGIFGAETASAQTLPSIDARTWRPTFDPGANLVLEPATVPGAGNWNVGAFAQYSFRPITVNDATTGNTAYRPVDQLVGLDLGGSVGITDRLALGVSLPIVVWQDGTSGLPSAISSSSSVPSTAIGDLGFSLKATLISNSEGGFGLASITNATLPTGDRTSFYGDGSVTVATRFVAEYSLVIITANASLGYMARTDQHVWPSPESGGITFGDTIPWSFGITMNPSLFRIDPRNRHRIEIAAHGWLPGGPVGPFGAGDPGSAAQSPIMLMVDDRWEIGHYRDVYATYGVDIGLDTAVGVPAIRGIVGIGWRPRSHDMDNDGIPDDLDQCPEIPEDIDGFEDSDGCPDIDDDNDGIVDKEDACPRVPGVASSDPKKNGCPPNDRDHDGVADDVDACPDEWGEASTNPKLNGCPMTDRDGDGIADKIDRCPDQAEDLDGFQDEDGCPDPDDDGDGIADKEDACPRVAGEPSTDPAKNGCPNPDRDGDTFENSVDKCPDAAEVFNGVEDDDGCPDEGGKPLVTFVASTVPGEKDGKVSVKLASPIKFTGEGDAVEVAPESVVTLRAIALELSRHRDYTLAIGARPAPAAIGVATTEKNSPEHVALARAFAVAKKISALGHREGIAETVGWDAVKNSPNAASGLGIAVLVTPASPTSPSATPKPLAPVTQANTGTAPNPQNSAVKAAPGPTKAPEKK